MSEPIHIEVRAVKGGVGCTVVACMMAIAQSVHRRTLLVDASGGDDVYAVLGVPQPDYEGAIVDVTPTLEVTFNQAYGGAPPEERHDVVIWDIGTKPWSSFTTEAMQVWVVQNDYVGLRRWLHVAPQRVDSLVLVKQPGRSLNERDIEAAIGQHITSSIDWDPGIARCVDAGLLLSRAPLRGAFGIQQVLTLLKEDMG